MNEIEKSCQNCKDMETFGGYCADCHNHSKWSENRKTKNRSFLNKIEKEIIEFPRGKKLGTLLSDLTICPVRNGTCLNIIDIVIREIYADLEVKTKFEDHHIWLCGLGCTINTCRLNK